MPFFFFILQTIFKSMLMTEINYREMREIQGEIYKVSASAIRLSVMEST